MLRRFRQGLLRWYSRHQRDLPWRRTRDPYHVLVSEIMLQQTQVDRVIPKYHEFLGRYPTLEALATADVADVTRTWYPLGYNIRPVHLHGIAREALARYGGQLPEDDKALRSMKGIGRYTAGAVRSLRLRGARPDPRHERPARPRPCVSRPGRAPRLDGGSLDPGGAHPAASASVRLQPGSHGLRGNLVHRAEAALPSLPDATLLPRLSVGRDLTRRRAPSAKRPAPPPSLRRLLPRIQACRACPTMRGWRKFPPSAVGRVDTRFVLVGEAPGIASVVNGRQWTGAGGMILRREIRRLGLDLEDLFYLTNAVKCWPAAPRRTGRRRPGNRSPLPVEARQCRPFLAAELEAIRPDVVVAVGAVAARAVLDHPVRLPDDHGRRYQVGNREVVVLLHPANANRHPSVWPTYRDSLLALFGELAARTGFPVLEVAAAVIERAGRILVTRRDPAKHMGGLWEFPGGKRERGESIEACLRRELDEELGVRAHVGARAAIVPWAYPERRVLLHFFRCRLARGRVRPREGQDYRWVTRSELAALPMPPADAEIVALLVATPGADRNPRAVTERSGGPGGAARSRRPSPARREGSPRGSPAT